jgi:hypothetical protein
MLQISVQSYVHPNLNYPVYPGYPELLINDSYL